MKKLLLAFLLTFSAFGATGDITGVAVNTNGWDLFIWVSGSTTNGTYAAMGFGTNNTITGSEKIVLTLTSQGYDDTGAATTVSRTLYGTKYVRHPYPSDAYPGDVVDGSSVRLRFALSDYVYTGDSNVTATIAASLYTQSGTPSAAGSGLSVTNNSTATYQRVVGNWSWPGYQLMDSSSKLRCVAFHSSARFGRPVRAVKFTVTDGTTTNTQTLTSATVDRTVGDAVPVVEYVSTSDLTSGLTQGAVLTCNFVAYPWVGDSSAILDTSTGTAAPTPLYGPIKAVCNRTGAYGTAEVWVSPSGNDATGSAYAYGTQNEAGAAKCLTINGAMVKLAAFNNSTYSRNDLGGGYIYLADGSYAWTGGSGSIGTVPNTWVTITRSASAAIENVILDTASGDADATDRVKITGVKVKGNANLYFNGIEALWFDQCNIDQTGIGNTGWAMVYGAGNWWITRNNVIKLYQGLIPFSTQNTPPCLIRGNNITATFTTTGSPLFVYTVLGNKTSGTVATLSGWFKSFISGSSTPTSIQPIVGFNAMWGINCVSLPVWSDFHNRAVTNIACVQNIFENYTNGAASLFAPAGDGSVAASSPVKNVIMWHNTFVGQRVNYAYNDTTTNAPLREQWWMVSNLYDDPNIKSDTFSPQDGVRVGNWSVLYGVGSKGEMLTQVTNIGASGFTREFAGINAVEPVNVSSGYMKYRTRASYNGSAAGAGFGDYRLGSDSPTFALVPAWVLPFDIAGAPRGRMDPPGAYAAGQVRKGGMF